MKFIIVAGNPIEGFCFYGVYNSSREAIAAGKNYKYLPPDWWVSEVEPLDS
jgi:hypothetical protein